jgi:ketosteroid isomerase-like protein
VPEESTPPDLFELSREQLEAVNRGDLDTLMSFCPADGVYDTSPSGLGVYEGPVAIRAFIEAWWDAFEELTCELEELVDLGKGVMFSVIRQEARPVGSSAHVQTREAHVTEWMGRMTVRVTVYTDIDEGRAAAERLAKSRG